MSVTLALNAEHGGLSYAVDLALPAPGITALFGPSGAGKSTLLRVIAGLEKIEGAKVSFERSPWQSSSVFVPPHERRVGFVAQEPVLFSHLDVMGNLEFAMARSHINLHGVDLPNMLALLGIEHLLERQVHKLSGGEKQRVAIARALAANPKVLLLDEPLTGIDSDRAHEILPFIEQLRDHLEIPVVYVSHSMDEVARVGDFLALMESGRIIGNGPLSKMLTREDMALATRADAEAILTTKAVGYDSDHLINTLSFSGGQILAVGERLPVGEPIRIRIASRDVSVTLDHQEHTSILNILPATVAERCDLGAAHTLIHLQVGEQILLSRMTRRSADGLSLAIGDRVYAQVKSIAVLQ